MRRSRSSSGACAAATMASLTPEVSYGLTSHAWANSRGPGELAQHERSGVVVAARDVLLGDQIHAIAQRSHQHDVGCRVERDQLLAFENATQVVDGSRTEGGQGSVEPAHQHFDVVTDLLVLRNVLLDGTATCTKIVAGSSVRLEDLLRTPSSGYRFPWCSRADQHRSRTVVGEPISARNCRRAREREAPLQLRRNPRRRYRLEGADTTRLLFTRMVPS